MKMVEVQNDIGFADGHVVGYERVGATLVVHVKTWNSKELTIKFVDVQLILDLMPGDIAGFYRVDEESELMRKARSYVYALDPRSYAYKHFAFMNNDGQPCFDIIAADVEIVGV